MKTYLETENLIYTDIFVIPKQPDNALYNRILNEVKTGTSQLAPYKTLITWDSIRIQRNKLLLETDWIGAEDAKPKPSKEVWLNYRQDLRDIPQNFSTPELVIWPTKPL